MNDEDPTITRSEGHDPSLGPRPQPASRPGQESQPDPHAPTDAEAETSAIGLSPPDSGMASGKGPGGDPSTGHQAGQLDAIPERIGPYIVIEPIGRGGMGSVVAAMRHDDPFQKIVAIKIIRRGLDTRDMLDRFELERRVLTTLNHPNIARVLDAGQTDTGQPYFVMEHVDGEPIDRYCDRAGLGVPQRLALFNKVCAAVHEAHKNLIVHRDIKPSNVLVTRSGEPKLLDFGIAKVLNPERLGLPALTQADQRLLTYEYASPEQVRGQAITTSSDVYALGVLLYELLTGRRPYRIERRVHHEAVRVICEHEPIRPSTAVTRRDDPAAPTRPDSTPAPSTRHAQHDQPRPSTYSTRLRRALAGDLDTIILKTLQKSPQRRYESALALADDLDRHLRGLPVRARPDSVVYRAGKFARRHRAPLAALAAIGLALLGGLVAERAARAKAQERFESLRRLFTVYNDAADRLTDIAGSTAARRVLADALDDVAGDLEREAARDPVLLLDLARLRTQIGELSYDREGNPAAAVADLEAALDLLDRIDAPHAPERLRALLAMAEAQRDRGDVANAARTARVAAGIAQGIPSPLEADRLRRAEAHRVASWSLLRAGDGLAAEAQLATALDIAKPAARAESPPGPWHTLLAGVMLDLAALEKDRGNSEGTIDALRAVVAAAEAVSAADPANSLARHRLVMGLTQLAAALHARGPVPGQPDELPALRARVRAIALDAADRDPLSLRATADAFNILELEYDAAMAATDHHAASRIADDYARRAEGFRRLAPTLWQAVYRVGVAHELRARALVLAGDAAPTPSAAAEAAAQAWRAYHEADLAHPDQPMILSGLVRTANRLGIEHIRAGESPLALDRFTQALHAGERLEAITQPTATDARDITAAAWNAARVARQLGDHARAGELFEFASRRDTATSPTP